MVIARFQTVVGSNTMSSPASTALASRAVARVRASARVNPSAAAPQMPTVARATDPRIGTLQAVTTPAGPRKDRSPMRARVDLDAPAISTTPGAVEVTTDSNLMVCSAKQQGRWSWSVLAVGAISLSSVSWRRVRVASW